MAPFSTAASSPRPAPTNFSLALFNIPLFNFSSVRPDELEGPTHDVIVNAVVMVLVFLAIGAAMAIVFNKHRRAAQTLPQQGGYTIIVDEPTVGRQGCGTCPGCRAYTNPGNALEPERDEAGYSDYDIEHHSQDSNPASPSTTYSKSLDHYYL
ncbi:hypothetical protein BKA70DRAFT_680538 [Coprinopsis sp. MPI-PUGE-AT-0042]|nr:hypothetical protein BKA70DRAFT_680538 [Coprinopsis sp. MPI-PUGE-AT-0042]